jgi:uncharacterized protein
MAEKSKRGFASMDQEKRRQIASMGGKAAHRKGAAHEFTPEEAREAGRKGGRMAHRRTMPNSEPVENRGPEAESAAPSAEQETGASSPTPVAPMGPP